MTKSPDAFRTISEVAEWLDRPAHVLRFWESKFTQVKPIKRAGGRRYYRPQDMLLLGGIKKLLHDDGMTIKGVQKMLREQGTTYVSDLSQPLDTPAGSGELVPSPEKLAAMRAQNESPESATLLHFPKHESPTPEEVDRELSSSSYEQAVEEYTATPDPDLSAAPPEDAIAPHQDDDPATTEPAQQTAPTAPEPDGDSFDTPSFFDVFDKAPDADDVAETTPDEPQIAPADPVADVPADTPFSGFEASTVSNTEPEEAIQDAEEAADVAAAPAIGIQTEPTPVTRKPAIVDVPIEASSAAGSGVMTRMIQNRARLTTVPPAHLSALRERISLLKTRLSGN